MVWSIICNKVFISPIQTVYSRTTACHTQKETRNIVQQTLFWFRNNWSSAKHHHRPKDRSATSVRPLLVDCQPQHSCHQLVLQCSHMGFDYQEGSVSKVIFTSREGLFAEGLQKIRRRQSPSSTYQHSQSQQGCKRRSAEHTMQHIRPLTWWEKSFVFVSSSTSS